MNNEMFSNLEPVKFVPLRAAEVQKEAMWLFAEEQTGQSLDRENPEHKALMLTKWFTKDFPGEKCAADFYGDYADAHPEKINPKDREAVLEVLHEVEETMH